MVGRQATTWALVALTVVAVGALTFWRLGNDPGPAPPPPPVDMAQVVLDVGVAANRLADEGGASIRAIGGAPGPRAGPVPSLSEARRSSDAALAAAAAALHVDAPVAPLEELRAEVDRHVGRGAAAGPSLLVEFEDLAARLLDEAERAVREVVSPPVRRGLELMVATDRLHVGTETLVAQLSLAPSTGQLTASWEELDRLVQEVQAEDAAPYADVVAAELPTELHAGLGELVAARVAGTAPDPQALAAASGTPSYADLDLALMAALTEAMTAETG